MNFQDWTRDLFFVNVCNFYSGTVNRLLLFSDPDLVQRRLLIVWLFAIFRQAAVLWRRKIFAVLEEAFLFIVNYFVYVFVSSWIVCFSELRRQDKVFFKFLWKGGVSRLCHLKYLYLRARIRVKIPTTRDASKEIQTIEGRDLGPLLGHRIRGGLR